MRLVPGAFLLLLGLLFTSCVPDSLRGPDPCDQGGALLLDEFDGDQDCGWVEYERTGARVTITDDVLRLTTSQAGQIWWTNAGRNLDNVIITAVARQTGGPDDNAYGVICRYQNQDNFYVFLISGDGYYAIGKYQSGNSQIEYLSGDGQYVPSEFVRLGEAENEIQASCVANQLSLTVNGQLLETVTDPTFVTGDIGLAASTFQPGTTTIEFDRILVVGP
jgi:hypothetical protein